MSELFLKIAAEILWGQMQETSDVLQENFFLVMFLDVGEDIFNLAYLFSGNFFGTLGFPDKKPFPEHGHDQGKKGKFRFKLIVGVSLVVKRKDIL